MIESSFYKTPSRSNIERRRKMAERLMKQGQQDGSTQVISGYAVQKSPLEGLAKALQSGIGQYQEKKAIEDLDIRDENARKTMAEAMDSYTRSQAGGSTDIGDGKSINWNVATPDQSSKLYANALMQNEDTAPMGMQFMQNDMQAKARMAQEMEQFKAMMPLKVQLSQAQAQARGPSVENLPAPMKIANQMFELEQIMNNPNVPEVERFMAERQYNLLGQAAKTYGFDRGFQTGPVPGYDQVFSAENPVPPMTMDMLDQQMPQVQNMPPPALNQLQDIATQPLPPQDMNDPMARNMMAVQQQQQEIGVSPGQRPDMVAPQVSAIPGYGETMAQMAAQKKAAEGRASEVGKRQGENENLYRSTVARMPQLENTVTRLSKLGQAATFNNAGLVRDFAARELNLDIPDAAIARAQYISMVDNEILPLLRDTFGAQFTQKEGESLKATLGAPNVSPQEKDAVLKSFINTKMQSLDSMRRELSYGDSIPSYTAKGVVIGGQKFNPQAKPRIVMNPQTGERLIDRGNGWEPYNGQ